jgi:hypothetical protein
MSSLLDRLNTPDASGVVTDFDDPNERLRQIAEQRAAMEENLSPNDRDLLFNLLWEAQQGDPDVLKAIYEQVYEEIPVPMDEFVLSKRYLGFEGQINDEKLVTLDLIDQPHVRTAYLALGSGSGKSLVVSIVQARMVYLTMCLRNPQLFYMLSPGAGIAIVNLSVSKEQARDVVFAEFKARLTHSPWFTSRGFKAGSVKAAFPKKVAAFSGGSNAVSFYGYHTLAGSLDEASFMLEGETEIAEELTEALTKSMNTRFPRAWKLLVISTLRSHDDYLYRNVERLKETGVRML